QSTRWTTSESLRSTFGANLVNEFRVGGSGGATLFSPELEPGMFTGTGGYRLNFNTACCGTGFTLTNLASGGTTTGARPAGNSSREASTKVIEDNATWIKGSHSFTFGGSMVQADVWLENQTKVPTIAFGLIPGESAITTMFTAANFPGASTADINQAQSLYAMLTGRISQIAADARINQEGTQYVTLGRSRAAGRMREFDFYASDSWRMSPNVTVSAGLRYVLANPFYPVNNSYTTISEAGLYGVSGAGNLFKPGTIAGTKPQLVQYPEGAYAYDPDRNNFGPSAGVAWQIGGVENGIGRMLLGSATGDSVIRGGFAMAYQRPGMSDFTGVFGANQGIQVTLNRDNASGNLGALPLLLRNTSALALPTAPGVAYPVTPSITNSINTFDSNLQMPWTQSYTVGWQRKITSNTAVELRYVGSRHRQDWETVNINEISITSNGFLQEFRKAQANLQANIAAGRGATFAYNGRPGQAAAAALPRVPDRTKRGAVGQHRGVHRHELDERDVPRLPRGAEPEPVRLRVDQRDQRLRGQLDVPQQRRHGRSAGELLPRQSGRRRRHGHRARVEPDDELRRHAVQLGAVRVPQAAVRRAALQRQLRMGPGVHRSALRLHQAGRGDSAERTSRRRAARHQGQLVVGRAARQEPPVRQLRRRERGPRRLVDRRRRPPPDRRDARLRQRAPRGDDGRRAAQVGQAARGRERPAVRAAAGHHRQHRARVPGQRDVADRLRRRGADRPLHGAGQRS